MNRILLFLLMSFICSSTCKSQHATLNSEAERFLSSLTEQQKKLALLPFMDEERYNWHFFPKNDRKGVSLNALNSSQKNMALQFLHQCLSDQGYKKALGIMQLETVLKSLEHRSDSDGYRDPGKYYFLFLGDPSISNMWSWRIEGHHLSISFSTTDKKIVSGTPSFMGSNPGLVASGPEKGIQVLKEEADKGFELLHALKKDQFSSALLSDTAPNEIITFVSRKAMIEKPAGILYSALEPKQQQLFWDLVNIYIHRYTKLFAADMLKEIRDAGTGNLRFAWAGASEPGKPHYYRIQGPTLIIEYDNSQNNANHVHTVIRDLKHDFGGDELLQHYQKSH